MRVKQPRHPRLLLFFGATVLLAMGILWGLPNHWDFAQDSVVPMGSLANISANSDEVTSHRYPPLHLKALDILWIPLRAIVTGSPSLSQNRKLADTLFILSARAISLAMTLGVVAFLIAIGRRLWDNATGILAGLLFVVAPVTLYYGKNANLDAPYLFWLTAAFFFYVRILQENRLRDYVWLGLMTALSVCTKDQAYAFFVLMPIPLILRLWRRSEDEAPLPAKQRYKRLGLGLAAFVIAFVLIHNILFDAATFKNHIITITGDASAPWREYTRALAGQIHLAFAMLLRLMDAWTPAALLLAAVGIWGSLQKADARRKAITLLLPAISYYIFFPAIIGYVYTRFSMPIVVVLSLFAARGVIILWQKAPRAKVWQTAAVILVGWTVLGGISVNYVMTQYSRYDAQHWLEDHCDGNTRIIFVRDENDMPTMPRLNHPLSPQPLLTEEELKAGLTEEAALMRKRPQILILSLQQGLGTSAKCARLSSIIRRGIAPLAFGRHAPAEGFTGFRKELLDGKLGYKVCETFENPISPFVPEVSESLNRTIIILEPMR
jgi:4-amino-4-deoxy-L-arabinose transferase-like glycosyltransferase